MIGLASDARRVVLIALAGASYPIASAAAQRPSPHAQAFVAITVANLDASVRWYETFLGAHRVSASRAPSGIAENVTVANGYLMAELIHFAARAPTDTAVRDLRDVGLQKVGAWVEAATFDSTLAHLRRLDAKFIGGVFADSAIRARSFIVKDNSGVLIQFFAAISQRVRNTDSR